MKIEDFNPPLFTEDIFKAFLRLATPEAKDTEKEALYFNLTFSEYLRANYDKEFIDRLIPKHIIKVHMYFPELLSLFNDFLAKTEQAMIDDPNHPYHKIGV